MVVHTGPTYKQNMVSPKNVEDKKMKKRHHNTPSISSDPADIEKDIPYDPSVGAQMINNYNRIQNSSSEQEEQKAIEVEDISLIEEEPTNVHIDNNSFKNNIIQSIVEQIPVKIETSITKKNTSSIFLFNDLRSENDMFMKEINERWKKVIESGTYINGNQRKEMEERLAKLVGKKYCIAVGNYTDAIRTVLKGTDPESQVILPSFGCDAARSEVTRFKDNALFIDVDESLTIDVKKLPDVKNGIILAVHLFGNHCNMKMIKRYASQNNHIIIEDCSHSMGSGSGQAGDFSILSFSPGNPLSTIGDGGAILMDDKPTHTALLGLKTSVMGEMECAVVNSKLDKFEHLIEKRRNIAGRYKKIVDGIRINSNCIYQQFIVIFNERDKVIDQLKKQNIPFMVPDSIFEDVSIKLISLPCHPFMNEAQINMVETFLKENKKYEY